MKKASPTGISLLTLLLCLTLILISRRPEVKSPHLPDQPLDSRRETEVIPALQSAKDKKSQQPLENLDVRLSATKREALNAARIKALETFRKNISGVTIDLDPVTQSPKWIGSNARLLSDSQASLAAKDPDAPVKQFIANHRELFGHGPEVLDSARRVTDYSTARGPSRKVVWHQQLDGIDVFEAVLQANLSVDSALINIGSQMMPTPDKAMDAAKRASLIANPPVSVEQAVATAGENVGEKIQATGVRAIAPAAAQPDQRQQFRAAMLTDADARLVWVPMDASTVRLAWDVTLTSRSRAEMYRVLVDVEDSTVLVRHSMTAYISEASYRVYTTESPMPFSPGHETPSSLQPREVSRSIVTTSALDTTASPNGWINDGENITSGNNTDTYTDVDNNNTPDLPRTTGSPNRVFDFPMNTTQEPSTYKDASNTQLFYWTNFMHDRMYQLGFTEAAGNFQTNNFNRGGVGNDPVNAEAQDGSGTNNANFSTPVDGGRGRMQMYVWTSPTPDRDGSFEAEVVLHEYGHGVSNRLVGGPSVTISNLSTRGMGEGWSDFYGLALTAEPGDNPHGNWARGAYSRYLSGGWFSENYYYGARRYSYSTDMLKNPHTFRDIDPTQVDWHVGVPRNPTYTEAQDATQVHYQGTVWCSMLWEMRANLTVKHGSTVGNERALFLVTEGMKLGPANPNFVQARDGIIQAALVNHPNDLGEVWTAFAKRGMGSGATAPTSTTTTGITESYRVPDSLEINNRSGWNIRGNKGGPFTPTSQTLTLSNDGTESVNWSATSQATWLTATPNLGLLAPGESVSVTVTTQALQMESGFHSTNLVFSNTTTGFNQPIGIRLYVTPPVAYSFDLNTAPNWSMVGEWNYGVPTGSGGVAGGGSGNTDPMAGATGSHVFGVNLNGNVASAVGGPFYLTSAPINLSDRKATRLRFKRWLNTNSLSNSRMTVEVTSDGTQWREVFVNPGSPITDSAWQTLEYDISSIADGQRDVQVRWGYRTLVAGSRYSGWNLDDIEFLGEPTAQFTVSSISSALENSGTLVGTLNLNIAQTAAVTVTLTSSNPSAATVPSSIVLEAGEMTKNFDIQLMDDPDLDGTQNTLITASATRIASGSNALAVLDNESALLTLELPSNLTEDSTYLTSSIRVSAAPTRDIPVSLTSDNTALSVPATVVIPAGSVGPVTFTLTAPNNDLAEGNKMAQVTASVPQWTAASASVLIADNDVPTILITGPSMAREGDSAQTYTATLNTIQTSNRILELTSSDGSELTVPATLVIPAGQFSATFSATVVDDTLKDGSQSVAITASLTNYLDGTRWVNVFDNDVSHFTFANIASPQKRNRPFEITITARDANGQIITNYFGHVTLSSSSSTGPVTFSPTTASYFTQGVATEMIQVNTIATGMTLTASGGDLATGTSNAFDVEPVTHDRFVWSGFSASPTVSTETPFNTTVTAVNDQGSTVTSYQEATTIDLWTLYFDRTVGTGTNLTTTVYNTSAHDSRAQMIYTAAELGNRPRWISGIFFTLGTAGSPAMSNVTLRMKPTDRSAFVLNGWEVGGWQTVYTSTAINASTTYFPFNQPFYYDGTRNVMVDFSFNGTTATSAGTLRSSISTESRVIHGTSNSTDGDPLLWSSTLGPVPTPSSLLPNVTFYEVKLQSPLPNSPATFNAGSWSGQTWIPEISSTSSVWLRALSPSGVMGFSPRITLIAAPTIPSGTSTVFSDGFETSFLGTSWSTANNTGTTPRTQVTTSNTPKTGSYHLTLDNSNNTASSFARNSPTLTLNLAGRRNVSLEWFAKSLGDESHTPTLTGPLGTFGSTTNFDGVAISQDGINWVEVSPLRGLSTSYGSSATRVVLDPILLRLGWNFNSSFRIRFSQYDDLALPNDGIAFDDVAIRADASNAIALTLPTTVQEGAIDVPFNVVLATPAVSNTIVTLTSSAPARLSVPASVVVPAGQTQVSALAQAPQNLYAETDRTVYVRAIASGLTTGLTHLLIRDDEQPVLTLSLPTSVTEGGASVTGTCTIVPPPLVTTQVFFTSGNAAQATVTSFATIAPLSTSFTFSISAVNDTLLDGTQPVTITVSAPGMLSGTGSIDVNDNESLQLLISPPGDLVEGGTPGIGTISISGVRPIATPITLSSSDTSEATVPANVVIPAGQTSVNFQVFPVEDALQDGTQNVTLTASSPGLLEGQSTLNVRDNDPNAFAFSGIVSPQVRNAAIPIILFALDDNNQTLTDFKGTVTLRASDDIPVITGAPVTFVNGVWNGSVRLGATGSGITLTATGGDGATGTSNPFDVIAGGAATSLSFSPLPATIHAGSRLPLEITAVDANGVRVNEVNGSVTLQLRRSPGDVLILSRTMTLVNGRASIDDFTFPGTVSSVYFQASSVALSGQTPLFSVIEPPTKQLSLLLEVIFQDGFETGLLPQWSFTGTNTHRTLISTVNAPYAGAQHLVMDSSVNASFSRNEATLTLDLKDKQGVELSFWMKDLGDEDHAPPSSSFTQGADFDGVAISADGVQWHEIQGLRTVHGVSASYKQFTLNLSAQATRLGLTLNSAFKIRFNHYDDYATPTDGFAFDEVLVRANVTQDPEPVISVFEDNFETGIFRPEWTITGTGLHRTIISNTQGPRGTHHLLMDVHSTGLARNEATLNLDLSDLQDVQLTFWMKEFSDEDHGPPTIPFSNGANFDGVAISADGVTWYEVQGLLAANGIDSNYKSITIDLSAQSAGRRLTLGPDFKIRFNHYDDSVINSDGFAFDDIQITARPASQLLLTAPASIQEGSSGSATVSLPLTRSKDTVVHLSSNYPGLLNLPATLTLLAGQVSSAPFTLSALDNTLLTGDTPVEIVVEAEGYRRVSTLVTLLDNESASGFNLTLPAHLAEGSNLNGSVSVTEALLWDLRVALQASPRLGLQYPPFLTIPAGQSLVGFKLMRPENTFTLEATSSVITASAAASSDTATVSLDDNDAGVPLVITLPASLIESALPVTGTIGFSPPFRAGKELLITLTNSNGTDLHIPATLIIPEGSSSATFTVTPQDNAIQDGTRSATITATVTGLPAATHEINVLDDDLHHLSFSQIASPQVNLQPFTVTLRANAIDGALLSTFNGPANLTALSGMTPVNMNPSTLISFVNGVWTGQLTFPNVASQVIVTATTTGGISGSSNAFDVSLGPRLVVSPGTLAFSSPANEPEAKTTVTLSNPGVLPAQWNAEVIHPGLNTTSSLEEVLTGLNANASSITSLIPNRFDFSEGTTGYLINYGGNNLFNSGNFLGTNLNSSGTFLSYSDNAIANSTYLGSGGRYFTRKHPGLFVFAANVAGLTHFEITGWLGQNGLGTVDQTVLTSTRGSRTYKGFVKRVFGANTPSVNHLIIVANEGNPSHEISGDTGSDYHRLTGLAAVTRIYYLFYASNDGIYINDDQTQAIMEAFLDLAAPGLTLSVSPSSGTLATQGTATLTASFRAHQLPLGTVSSTLRFHSNDPTAPQQDIPVNLTIVPAVQFFTWNTIPSAQVASTPFSATLTAKNITGNPATDFKGEVSLSALGPQTETTSGTGTTTSPFPFNGSFKQSRIQSIYTPAEVGQAGHISGLEIQTAGTSGPLSNFTVRLKHTAKSSYTTTEWETSDWTTVYRGTFTVSNTGWITLPIQAAFEYNGTSNLMVDLSFNNGASVTGASTYYTTKAQNRSLTLESFLSNADPLLWKDNSPSGTTVTWVPNLRFSSRVVLPVSPARVALDSGAWSGQVSVPSAQTSVVLQAQHLKRPTITGISNSFNLTSSGQLTITAPATGVEGESLNASVSVNAAPSADLIVSLESSDTSELIVPSTVTIPAGQTSTNFTLTAVDDSVVDGSQPATIIATASGLNFSRHTLQIQDNDSSTITLNLPATLTEAGLSAFGEAFVELNSAADTAQTVNLSSSRPSRLTLPASILIPAGQRRAYFTLLSPENGLIQNPASVSVTATLGSGASDMRLMTILDNESRVITLSLFYTELSEGSLPVSSASYVILNTATAEPLTFQLSSSDETELTVPTTVIIPAGSSISDAFTLTPVNDADFDGSQTVTLTASAPSFTSASRTLTILDDDVHHFRVTPETAAKVRNKPFSLAVRAEDVNNAWITSYTGNPNVSAQDGTRSLPLTPASLGAFVSSTKTTSVTVADFASQAVITVTDPAKGISGASNPFAIGSGPAQRFVWSNIASPQTAQTPFSATITAVDEQGNTASSYSGVASLMPATDAEVQVGSAGTSWNLPLDSVAPRSRTQSIYTAAEIGSQRTIRTLSLNPGTLPGSPLSAFTIRLKHTAKSDFSNPGAATWESTGWTTCYTSASQTFAATGWQVLTFTNPFAYNGTDNLMVDISYANATTGSTSGSVSATSGSLSQTLHHSGDTSLGNPLAWSEITPLPTSHTLRPDLRFGVTLGSVPVLTPGQTGAFNAGVWTGELTVMTATDSLELLATQPSLTRGRSNAFKVLPLPTRLILTLPENITEGDGTVTGTLAFNQVQSADSVIQLSSSNTSALVAPSQVVIPAHTLSVPVVLTVVDDNLKDGVQNTVLTATATEEISTSATVSVGDDELHDFQISAIPSPQIKNGPFSVTLKARSIDGQTIPNYSGAPQLSAASNGIPIALNPSGQIHGFLNGQKVLNVFINAFVSQATLTLTDGATSATSNAFDVGSGTPYRFVWNALFPMHVANRDIVASLTTQDAFGNPTQDFNGPVSLHAEEPRTVGTGNVLSTQAFKPSHRSHRSQQVLLASEVGSAGRITSLAVNLVGAMPLTTLTDFTLRLKHTTRTGYNGAASDAVWESTGFTTVYQGNPVIGSQAQLIFRFSTPFDFNGSQNLMIDFSHRMSSAIEGVTPQVLSTDYSGQYRSIQYSSLSESDGIPLSWTGLIPAAQSDSTVVNVQLGFTKSSGVTPSSIILTNGAWNGSFQVSSAAALIAVQASSGQAGIHGLSRNFEVTAFPHALNPEPEFTGGTVNTLHWSAPASGLQYQVQYSPTADFLTVTNGFYTSALNHTFIGLTDGQRYHYRMRMRRTSGISWVSDWSPVVSSIQDATAPVITSELAATTAYTGILTGTATDNRGVSRVTVNGLDASTTDGFAHWSVPVSGLSLGTNTVTVTAYDTAVPPNSATHEATLVRTTNRSPTPLSFHGEPLSQWVAVGQTARLAPIVIGSRPVKFEWKKDGKTIPGATGPELFFSAVKTTDVGNYTITVSNGLGAPVESSLYKLAVYTALPENIAVKSGSTLRLSTTTTVPKLTSAPTFAWSLPNLILADGPQGSGAIVTGSAKNTLSVAKITATESGLWRLILEMKDAENAVTRLEKNIDVRVLQAIPVIEPLPTPLEVWVSQPVEIQLTASQFPTSYSVTGLPPGLTFDKTKGRVTGRVTTASRIDSKTGLAIPSVLKFTATNAAGTSAARELRLIVKDHFSALAGSYQGIVERHPITNFNMGGLVEFTLAKTGIATGSFTLAGQKHSFVAPVSPIEAAANASGVIAGEMAFRLPRKPTGMGDLTIQATLTQQDGEGRIEDLQVLTANTPPVLYGDGIAGSADDFDENVVRARFYWPQGMAVDQEGHVYVADTGNHIIRRLTPQPSTRHVTTTVLGIAGFLGSDDGGAARFNAPEAVVVDALGRLCIADTGNATIRRMDIQGQVITLAGQPGMTGHADGVGNNARFRAPSGLCSDLVGNLYITDRESHVVRKIDLTGKVTTLAGKAGIPGHKEGAGTAAQFHAPSGITYDPLHKALFVADTENAVIRRVTLTGTVSTYAGSPDAIGKAPGIGINARLNRPLGITSDGRGTLYVTDAGLWQINPAGATVQLFASIARHPDDQPADLPGGLVFDPLTRRVFLTQPGLHSIRQHHFTAPHSDSTFQVSRTPAANPDALAGIYNGSLSPAFMGGPNPLDGHGYFSMNVSSTGSVTFTGRLPDGQTLTAANKLASPRQVLLHSMLYKGTGSAQGILTLDSNNHLNASAPLSWLKIPQALSLADTSYPTGFDLLLDVKGSLYTPGNLHRYLGLTAPTAPLQFEALGGEVPPFTQPFTLTSPNTFRIPTRAAENPQKLSLTVVPSTGLFTGSFQTGSPARTAKFGGVFFDHLTEPTLGLGHFLLPESNQKGALIQSGEVIIEKP